MFFRFFRRIKIAPGLTINLSKGGASLSAGVRGARITLGKRGVRKTLGLPGTGLSWTNQSSWSKGTKGGDRFPIALADASKFELSNALNDSSYVLVNPSTNRKYTTRQLEKEKERRINEREKSELVEEIADFNQTYQELLNHWKLLPRIPTLKEFQAYRKRVEFNAWPSPKDPNYAQAKRELLAELALKKYQSFPYNMLPVSVSKRKARESLVQHWPEQANRIQEAYEKRIAEYNARMKGKKNHHEAKENERLRSLSKILSDDPQATTDLAIDVFQNIDWPFETEASLGTNDGAHLYINLDLPEQEDLIETIIPSLGRNLSIQEKAKPKRQQNEEYFQLVVGQAVFLSANEFAWNPTLQNVTVAGFTQRTRKNTKDPIDQHVYEITFSQDQIRSFNPSNRSLPSLLAKCGARIDINHNGAMKTIDRPSWIGS